MRSTPKLLQGSFCAAALLFGPTAALAASPGTINSGDTAWMLSATALVLLMTIPGVALFYGGMVRKMNVLATVMQSFAVTCLVTVLWAVIGYSLAYGKGQLFREGLFQFMTSFSLPLYAIVGAQKGVSAGLPVLGVLALAVIGPTAGRWYVDVSCGVPPKQFIRGEWFVSIAALTGLIWILCDTAGLPTWASALIAFAVGYTVRVLALYYSWEEPLATEPRGVYQHDDGRPMLGRKLKGKSAREMASLGLAISEPAEEEHR